ncbi:MAG TPA: tetratricopeptide repeat protein [Allocoleopsis sp.]
MLSSLCHQAEGERLHGESEGRYIQSLLGNGAKHTSKVDGNCRKSQLQSTLKSFQQALATAKAHHNRVEQVNILKRIGLIHCSLGEYAWGIKCLEQALQIAAAIANPTSTGVILNYLGAAYRQTGQECRALRVYLQALRIFKKLGNQTVVARILNRLGEIYKSLGEAESALIACRQALQTFQDLGHLSDGEGATLHNMGEVYLQLGRPRQAIALFKQALFIRQKIRHYNSEAMTLESIGTAYVQLNQELRGLEFYQRALKIRQDLGTLPHSLARNLNYIGAVYYKLGNYSLAIQHHLKAVGILQSCDRTSNNTIFLWDTGNSEKLLHHLVSVYESLDLHKQGVKCYHQALDIVRTFGINAGEEAIWNYFAQEIRAASSGMEILV